MKLTLLALATVYSALAVAQTGTPATVAPSSVPTVAQGTTNMSPLSEAQGLPANPAGYTQPTYPSGFAQPEVAPSAGAIQTPQTLQDSTNTRMSGPNRPRTVQEQEFLQRTQGQIPQAIPTQGIGIPDPQNPNPSTPGVNTPALPTR